MAFDPSDDERQELFRDGWKSFAGSDFKRVVGDETFWIGVPSGSRNRKYNVEWSRGGSAEQLGSATTINGALNLVRKKLSALSKPDPIASKPERQKTKRIAGRILVLTDWLQEVLDAEILRGDIIKYEGEAYQVGNFIGDKVELWRE